VFPRVDLRAAARQNAPAERRVPPPDFIADVEHARSAHLRGDLRLFAHECRGLPWAAEGLRVIGRTQIELGAQRDARESFQWLRSVRPEDEEAREQLAELAGALDPPPTAPARTLLFTGHMVDAPGRKEPRFPPTAAAEAGARRMIADAVARERRATSGPIAGVAGGACGGDILFHEICADLGIESHLYLALPPEPFLEASVKHGGDGWVSRFTRLLDRLPHRVLAETEELPSWVDPRGYSIWQRNNLWTLFNALSLDAESLTLIALWDGGRADGPGGTDDLVRQVRERGFAVDRLPAEELKTIAGDHRGH
jgi:hypothetical protein